MSFLSICVLTYGILHSADSNKVDLVMNLVERPSGGFSAGGGISSGWVQVVVLAKWTQLSELYAFIKSVSPERCWSDKYYFKDHI